MENIVGSPVQGTAFFGRQEKIRQLLELLGHHDILLLGPRRIGKTSIARAMMAEVLSLGWHSIEVNVASCGDEREFLDKLLGALQDEANSPTRKALNAIGGTLSGLARRIKGLKLTIPGGGGVSADIGAHANDDWITIANDLLHEIAKQDQRWLIYIDELPIFLFNIIRNDPQHGVARVRRFLDWFRNDVRGLPRVGKVRWLVSGSVGLDTLVQQHGMADTINSMKHEGLEAFSEQVAVDMLMALANNYGLALTADGALQLVGAVHWPQPYYLQAAFHHLRSLSTQTPSTDVHSLIEAAVDRLAQPGHDNDFHHWEQRLTLQLSPSNAGHALALLFASAVDPLGVRATTLLVKLEERMTNAEPDAARQTFCNLRDILLRDAYWEAVGDGLDKRYRFCLEPLRRWWLRKNTL